ncbi:MULTISPECIES: helix-turn-helix transcriptional regulator [unclassified Streptomyces]|uniref:helix-turn-helix domain-containing protein n=1 Tax=unclassified Streptomyces TaxID=2593676 RepID=UPI00093F6348|nr:helix-turn-helix transcriptional regulator [Streptomyces sp. CB02366]OKJ38195.1 hypothetical protein AMK24_11025 [Streptomyces sp. CB02366]
MTTQPEADLRAQVKTALTTAHISQAEAARRLGLSTKHMSQMLTGRATLTLDWADRILTLCGMTLAVVAVPATNHARPAQPRIPLDDLTSDALDQLYDRLALLEAGRDERVALLEEARDALEAAGINEAHGGESWPRLVPAIEELAAERDAARARLDYHEQSLLPDLRRRAESDRQAIGRWRARAETAEARVTELETDNARLTAGQCLDSRAMCEQHHLPPVAGCPYPRCRAARATTGRAATA